MLISFYAFFSATKRIGQRHQNPPCNLRLLGILHRAVKVPVEIAKSQDADQISSSKGIVALLPFLFSSLIITSYVQALKAAARTGLLESLQNADGVSDLTLKLYMPDWRRTMTILVLLSGSFMWEAKLIVEDDGVHLCSS